jgi:hypothetical protein
MPSDGLNEDRIAAHRVQATIDPNDDGYFFTGNSRMRE